MPQVEPLLVLFAIVGVYFLWQFLRLRKGEIHSYEARQCATAYYSIKDKIMYAVNAIALDGVEDEILDFRNKHKKIAKAKEYSSNLFADLENKYAELRSEREKRHTKV